jgi:hypothetical protein
MVWLASADDPLAHLPVASDAIADLDNLADILVAEHHVGRQEAVLVGLHVGSAHSGIDHADHDLAGAGAGAGGGAGVRLGPHLDTQISGAIQDCCAHWDSLAKADFRPLNIGLRG